MSDFLLEYQFANLLFPQALQAIAHVRTLGRPVVLSDGDVVFQPRKIKHAGIWNAVDGAVLIYIHKEKVLDHVSGATRPRTTWWSTTSPTCWPP